MINLLAEAFRSPEVAIDLGTAAIRVASRSGGMRVQDSATCGKRAVQGGMVVDPDALAELLIPMLWESSRFGAKRCRALACTPTNVTSADRDAVTDSIRRAGAGSVTLVPEPVAAAVGAGLDIGSGRSIFLVDLGEGMTDCAVIQNGRVVQSHAVQVGCGDLRRKLRQCAKRTAHLELCDAEAERVLRCVGIDSTPSGKASCIGHRRGRIEQENLSRRVIQEALQPVLVEISGAITGLLRELPAFAAVQVIEDGIYLSGGGALLRGIREHVARATRMEVRVVDDPLSSVVNGARAMLPFLQSLPSVS